MSTAPDTQVLVERLEAVRDRPGTVELFDALILEDAEGVARALGAFPRHPRAIEVRRWLEVRGVPGPIPPSVESILTAHGIADLEEHLRAAHQREVTLQRALEAALVRASRAETVASAYAAVLVMLVLVGMLGWAAAIGVVPIFSPVPEAPARPAAPAPTSPLPPPTAG